MVAPWDESIGRHRPRTDDEEIEFTIQLAFLNESLFNGRRQRLSESSLTHLSRKIFKALRQGWKFERLPSQQELDQALRMKMAEIDRAAKLRGQE